MGGLKYASVPPGGGLKYPGDRRGAALNTPWYHRGAALNTPGGITRGFMGDRERTGSGAAKELEGSLKYALVPPGGGLKYPWDRRGTALNTPWYHRGAALNSLCGGHGARADARGFCQRRGIAGVSHVMSWGGGTHRNRSCQGTEGRL